MAGSGPVTAETIVQFLSDCGFTVHGATPNGDRIMVFLEGGTGRAYSAQATAALRRLAGVGRVIPTEAESILAVWPVPETP